MVSVTVDASDFDDVAATFASGGANVLRSIEEAAEVEIGPLWVDALESNASTPMESLIPAGARVEVDEASLTFYAAEGLSPLSGGLDPSRQWGGIEYGADPDTVTVSRLGRSRTQVVGTNFGGRSDEGRVAMPAIREVIPDMLDSLLEAAEQGVADGNANIEVG